MSDVVAVVGAGAAGMMAAATAARRGARVVLLEKNPQPGLKILISGGGRCNLTTTREGQDLEAQYGLRRGRFLRHALRSFPPGALRQHVEALGVALHEEDLEKIFPVSRRASDIRDALVADCVRAGVELRTSLPMRAVESDGDEFVITTAEGVLHARALVLATGGLSYPKTGTTGDGYAVARSFGHDLVPTVPALAPLAIREPWLNALQGLVLDARLTLRDRGGRELVQRRRPSLITHRGLSGPAPMDVSGYVEEVGGGCTLYLDLVPDLSRDEVERSLIEQTQHAGRRAVQHVLPQHVPERLRVALCARHGIDGTTAAELERDKRRALVSDLKALALRVEQSLGFAHAEVTRGGVPLDEVDPRSMQSRLRSGLFLCGEILDVDGPIGGFNFQAAFATGRVAGLSV
ncbi:MAG: NAD(P)/FAD-dependent oxidoreductase [Planctomycetota bacterium]